MKSFSPDAHKFVPEEASAKSDRGTGPLAKSMRSNCGIDGVRGGGPRISLRIARVNAHGASRMPRPLACLLARSFVRSRCVTLPSIASFAVLYAREAGRQASNLAVHRPRTSGRRRSAIITPVCPTRA